MCSSDLYDKAPETAVAVYVVLLDVPTIEQILVNPVNEVVAANVVVDTVAVTAVLVAETHEVVVFLAVA